MNWILLEAGELDERGAVELADRRADHILRVLGAREGETLRIAVINDRQGSATVERIAGKHVRLLCVLDPSPTASPDIDLILAVPRPKVMRRLWAPLASLGVSRIILTNAEKVERCYFDTHWLLPATFRPLLVEGLEQSGEPHRPEVRIRRRLKVFLEDELNALMPDTIRWLAHPGSPLLAQHPAPAPKHRSVVAIGPEGGWTPYEVSMFTSHGFRQVGLGRRILRTDTACIAVVAALGALHESTADRQDTAKPWAVSA